MRHLLLPALLLASPALAGSNLVIGETCDPILTVQNADCTVTIIRACSDWALGASTSVTYDLNGRISAAASDENGAWLESFTTWDNAWERAIGTPEDPVSLDTLLSEGIDTYNFRITHEVDGESRILQVIGADILTGVEQRIDNVPLKTVTTDLRILEADGSVFYQTQGMQFVQPEMRLWLLGTDSVIGANGSVTNYDSSPVDFIFPGEPGFGETMPLFGCEPAPEHGQETAPQPVPGPVGPGANTNK